MFVFLARRRYLELSKSCKAQTPLGEYTALLPLGGVIASFSCKNLEHLQLHLVSHYWVAKTHADISGKIEIFHSHPWLTYCTRPWKQGENYDMVFIAVNYSMPYHENMVKPKTWIHFRLYFQNLMLFVLQILVYIHIFQTNSPN